VPHPVQELVRDAAVGDAHPAVRGRIDLVAQGTRKQHDLVVASRPGGEVRGEVVDVLPDARPLAEGRAVVDDNPHDARRVARPPPAIDEPGGGV
jgi:hypothetical protein